MSIIAQWTITDGCRITLSIHCGRQPSSKNIHQFSYELRGLVRLCLNFNPVNSSTLMAAQRIIDQMLYTRYRGQIKGYPCPVVFKRDAELVQVDNVPIKRCLHSSR
jgi:hypothetical protein